MTSPSVKLLRTQTDDRLVALAAAGHERAFEAIVERYRRPLLRHCRRYLPEARAEDALQQALVSAWSALRRGDDVRELRPWLHRIVHNTSLNALRAAGYDYEQLHDTLHGSGGPAELAERRAVVRQTLAGLAALPERQREALLQIAVEGRSQEEVAEELGLSHGAVRQLVHRARTSLRTAATARDAAAARGLARGRRAATATWSRASASSSPAPARGATLAKAGAVAALAGGAVAGPAVVDRIAEQPAEPARAARDRSARALGRRRHRRSRPGATPRRRRSPRATASSAAAARIAPAAGAAPATTTAPGAATATRPRTAPGRGAARATRPRTAPVPAAATSRPPRRRTAPARPAATKIAPARRTRRPRPTRRAPARPAPAPARPGPARAGPAPARAAPAPADGSGRAGVYVNYGIEKGPRSPPSGELRVRVG